jgi:hypothetical protein
MADLDEVIADLGYAAGTGAVHLGEKVKNDAQQSAMLGRPGPGLRQGLAYGGGTMSAHSSVGSDVLAHQMAVEAAQGGAELAVGKR